MKRAFNPGPMVIPIFFGTAVAVYILVHDAGILAMVRVGIPWAGVELLAGLLYVILASVCVFWRPLESGVAFIMSTGVMCGAALVQEPVREGLGSLGFQHMIAGAAAFIPWVLLLFFSVVLNPLRQMLMLFLIGFLAWWIPIETLLAGPLHSTGIPPWTANIVAGAIFYVLFAVAWKWGLLRRIPSDIHFGPAEADDFPKLDLPNLERQTEALKALGFVPQRDCTWFSDVEADTTQFMRLFIHPGQRCYAYAVQFFFKNTPLPLRSAICSPFQDGWSLTTNDQHPLGINYMLRLPRRLGVAYPGAPIADLMEAHLRLRQQMLNDLDLVIAEDVSVPAYYALERRAANEIRVAFQRRNAVANLLQGWWLDRRPRYEWFGDYGPIRQAKPQPPSGGSVADPQRKPVTYHWSTGVRTILTFWLITAAVLGGLAVLGKRPWEPQRTFEEGVERAPGRSLYRLAFSPDGTKLYGVGFDFKDGKGVVWSWDPVSGDELTEQPLGIAMATALFSPDGRKLLIPTSQGTFDLWDLEKRALEQLTIQRPSATMFYSIFSENGRVLASTGLRSLQPNAPGVLWIYDLEKRAEKQLWEMPFVPGTLLALSPDGRSVLMAQNDGTIHLHDTETGELRHKLSGHRGPLMAIEFSDDGCTVVSGGTDKTIRVWDAESGMELQQWTPGDAYIVAFAVSPNSQGVAVVDSKNALRVWDRETGKVIAENTMLPPRMISLVFSPDGRQLAGVAMDGKIRIWNPETGEELQVIEFSREWVLEDD